MSVYLYLTGRGFFYVKSRDGKDRIFCKNGIKKLLFAQFLSTMFELNNDSHFNVR